MRRSWLAMKTTFGTGTHERGHWRLFPVPPLILLLIVGCIGKDIVNQPMKKSTRIEMLLVANMPGTEFRIREQHIAAGPDDNWRVVGTGREVTAEIFARGRYEISAQPPGYVEKRVALAEPVKRYSFHFLQADRVGAARPGTTHAYQGTPRVQPYRPPSATVQSPGGPSGGERRPGRHTAPPASIRNVHVLVIGIGQYKDPNIPKLTYTTADAKAVYEFFRNSSRSPARQENVHLLGDQPNEDGLIADRRGITVAISRYLVRKAIHKDDMAILFFAGHGDTGRHPTKGTEYYLIPMDASKQDLFATAIERSEFQRLWSAIPARTKLLLADACNSGGFTGIRGVAGVVGVEGAVLGEAQAVFSACRSSEKSLEVDKLGHGLFTYVLLQGLKGKADAAYGDNDGRVTLAELKRWLDKQIPLEARKHGGRQTPVTSLVAAWGKVFVTR